MNGSKTSSGHTMTVPSRLLLLTIALLALFHFPTVDGKSSVCSYNGDGDCTVKTEHETDKVMDLLLLGDGNQNQSQAINWKIRPQNIGFMYYLRTSDDGDDLGVRGIVKWKVHLKNWSTNDTAVEGFLVSILDHDTNETVVNYELSMSEAFVEFVETHELLEMRLELDDILTFDKRYDAKINILPLGKQAAASSFLSIMGKLDGEPCSAKTGLAERWAPHVMADVFETTSEIELYWKPAPSLLCIKTYEVFLQNMDGYILNTTEIEVIPGQKIANAVFQNIKKGELVQVKVRGKNALDGGCACVNCNCITDKTKFFLIDYNKKEKNTITTPTPIIHHHEPDDYSTMELVFFILLTIFLLVLILAVCFLCTKYRNTIFKQKVAFNALKTSRYPNKKIRAKKSYKVMVVCPEVTGRDYDYMMRIADGLRKSSNTVVFDRWKENAREAEENMLHWVYEQTRVAEKILVFHSASYHAGCGIYDIIDNFFPSTDPRLIHVALTPNAQRNVPREVEYIMPRDQKHLEEAFDIIIENPLVIDIPLDNVVEHVHRNSCESIVEGPQKSKTHSTDSGVSSMSSNSSQSGGNAEPVLKENEIPLQEINQVASAATAGPLEAVESHPLLEESCNAV